MPRSSGWKVDSSPMRLLLDTQILIWWLLDDPRLGQPTRALIANHPCLVSVAAMPT